MNEEISAPTARGREILDKRASAKILGASFHQSWRTQFIAGIDSISAIL
jgi:hypothetical protein